MSQTKRLSELKIEIGVIPAAEKVCLISEVVSPASIIIIIIIIIIIRISRFNNFSLLQVGEGSVLNMFFAYPYVASQKHVLYSYFVEKTSYQRQLHYI